jgi:metal-responsive CopG/Arc/MetJ family transcriptional regulator
MKTAISLPDSTYEAATRRAKQLGISRSEFFAVAAQRYLDDLDVQSLTATIDEALAGSQADDSTEVAVLAGRHRLADDEDW